MSTHTIAVDPGIRGCGVAHFMGGRLTHAAYVRNPAKHGGDCAAMATMAREVVSWVVTHTDAAPLDALLLELPQVYTAGKGKGDPNDLLALAGVVGALATALPWRQCITYRPRAWKGTINPDILTARISAQGPGAVLSPEEYARADKVCASLAHNMWDAVGIGLYYRGRLQTAGKVYPGATPARGVLP